MIIFLLTIPLLCQAQKKIYTRSYRIQDFKSRTTKVVLGAAGLEWSADFDAALREDVTSLWDVSPYEFISAGEFEARKAESDSYFLFPVIEKGIVYLTLLKGGPDKDPDALRTSMKLVSVPVAGEQDSSTLVYMPAFVSMVQDYMDAAISSERVAYSGIKAIKRCKPSRIRVYRDPAEAAKVFHSGDDGAAVRITITPDGSPKSRPRYKMCFGAASYELYSFSRAL